LEYCADGERREGHDNDEFEEKANRSQSRDDILSESDLGKE
jgi:hypothetical protein